MGTKEGIRRNFEDAGCRIRIDRQTDRRKGKETQYHEGEEEGKGRRKVSVWNNRDRKKRWIREYKKR